MTAMNRIALMSVCLLVPGPASPTPKACSAQGLSATPPASPKPLPAAVESMRRRIIAAAVACDYAALAVLIDERGEGLQFSFGPDEDAVAFWREQESRGEPALAELVKILRLASYESNGLYIWPRAAREESTPQDFAALKGIYSKQQLKEMRHELGGYVRLRVGISQDGDWQSAIGGD